MPSISEDHHPARGRLEVIALGAERLGVISPSRGSFDGRKQRIARSERLQVDEAEFVVTRRHHPTNYAEAGVHFHAEGVPGDEVCTASYPKTTRRDILYENNLRAITVKAWWPCSVGCPLRLLASAQ